MDNRLTADEASRLYDALFPHVNYLLRLKKRFEELRIIDDPLYAEACNAYQAAWSLMQAVHDRSTRMGHGNRPHQRTRMMQSAGHRPRQAVWPAAGRVVDRRFENQVDTSRKILARRKGGGYDFHCHFTLK
jgi:hypothetical protein